MLSDSTRHDHAGENPHPSLLGIISLLMGLPKPVPANMQFIIQVTPMATASAPMAATSAAEIPTQEELPDRLGSLTAEEVRYLARARRMDVTKAIQKCELPASQQSHRRYSITCKDALAWIEMRKLRGFDRSRTLLNVWLKRQRREN